MRLVSVVTSTRSPTLSQRRISASRSSTCPETLRTSTAGSSNPVGRMICSTALPPHSANSISPGVADANITSPTMPRNSSRFRGRLSRAEGRRNPYSTRVSFRDRSPSYMPPI